MKLYDSKKPYNALPLLPPGVELDTKAILLKTISASRALAKLNGALNNLPNPTLFLDTVHLREAKASSEIENIITTNDELYQAYIAEKEFTNPASKEVLNYKRALWVGLERLKTKPLITTNLCVEIVQCIKQNTAGIRNTTATVLKNGKGKIIYTPPSGEEVIRDKLANLEEFINQKDEIDPLIKMAIAHYQIEAIHPFFDGNGRAGRIIMLLHLNITGLLDIPVICLSEYIIKHKTAYYRKIKDVTEHQKWEAFILYMLDMVEITANNSLKKLQEIIQLMTETAEQIRKELPKIYSKELIEAMFRMPYTKRKRLVELGIGSPKTAGKYLSILESTGFLSSIKLGKEKLYLNVKLMATLET
ncbi:UNVERIFIED_CONTAM: hypothetical protein GTU68_065681 [Idotea baltica]|nr:hypothetical protein [Idotea baltica]